MKNNRKTFNRVFAMFLSLAVFASFIVGYTVNAEVEDTASWRDKVDDALFEKMQTMTDDELVSVYIWRDGKEIETTDRILREEYNMDPMVYGLSSAFEAEVVPAIEEAVRAEFAGDSSVSEEEINKKIQEETLKVQEHYRQTRLSVMKEAFKQSNDKFLAEYVDTENRRVEYVGAYTGTIILDATKAEIIAYTSAETVTDLSLNTDAEADTDDIKTQSGDVNDDGSIDNIDAALVLKYDAGIINLIDIELIMGNVNGDNKVDNIDASLILKYDAGLINSL